MTVGDLRLLWASIVTVFAFQVLHVVIPADAEGGSYSWTASVVVGALEIVLLVAGLGLRRGSDWAPPVAGWAAGATALVFLLYHALPFRSAVTNPYPGEVGVAPWVPVVGIILGGIGCVYVGLIKPVRTAATAPT